MVRFFMTHQCNKFCKGLGLVHLNDEIKGNSDHFWEIRDFEKLRKKNEILIRLCDLCKFPYEVTKRDYIKRYKEHYCLYCDEKCDKMEDGGKCITCNIKFIYSPYWFLLKRTENPIRCSNCRKKERNTMRSKLNLEEL